MKNFGGLVIGVRIVEEVERRIVHGSASQSDLIHLGLDLAPSLNGCDFGVGS